MTLDKHIIKGVKRFKCKVLPIDKFEQIIIKAGYYKVYTAPTFKNRIKVWFTHDSYGRLECIYSLDNHKVITAYHNK